MTTVNNFGPLNNANFLNEVDEFLSEVHGNFDQEKEKLKYYQKLTTEYMVKISNNPDIRGCVVAYETGLGKTITAISIIDALSNYYNVYYISPKTLAANLPANIKKYIDMGLNITPKEKLLNKIKYINISSTLVKKLGENNYVKDGFAAPIKALQEGLVIIDEAHKLFQMIANGSAVGKEFYDIIRNSSPKVKLVFLSGSMITSDPFESVPAFNMLHVGKEELFPTLRDDFYNLFIDSELNMKNKEYYQNRIMGFISSVKGIASLEGYPTINEPHIIKVPMTSQQYKLYDYYRDLEKKEALRKPIYKNNAEAFGKKSSKASTYRVYTRQISNFAPPQTYFTDFVKSGVENSKYIEEHLDDIDSPKTDYLINEILPKHKNHFGLIYSQFTGIGGLNTLKHKLLQKGYKLYEDGDNDENVQRFHIIDGDTTLDMVNKYLEISASVENKNGRLINFLLLSVAGVTGLDFKNVKFGVVLEPHFSPHIYDQFKGRTRRYLSLEYLPKEDWFIDMYIMMAVVPEKYLDLHPTSTDQDVFNIENRKRGIIAQFMEAIEEVSIECQVFKKLGIHSKKCKRCLPNNNRLYTSNIFQDVKNENPCISYDNENMKQFEYEGKTFYYDGKKIYNENKIPLNIMDPLFIKLIKYVTKL